MSELRANDRADAAADTIAMAPAPRSGRSVLAILGALIALPLLIVILVMLMRGTGSRSGEGAAEGVRSGRVQSVELTNGRVLFGRLEAREGGWVVLEDAFFLRRTGGAAAGGANGADDDEAGTELVPISAEQGGDGDIVINAAEIVSFQNLAKDSDIGSKIEDAAK